MNRKRLEKLEKALLDGTIKQETFDIQYWCTSKAKFEDVSKSDVEICEYNNYCDTVSCVVGHTPRVFPRLFKKYVLGRLPPNWRGFSKYLFNLESDEWNWCFDAEWYRVDNTIGGAALRIRHLLNHGVPVDDLEQKSGVAPYLFQKELDEAKQ